MDTSCCWSLLTDREMLSPEERLKNNGRKEFCFLEGWTEGDEDSSSEKSKEDHTMNCSGGNVILKSDTVAWLPWNTTFHSSGKRRAAC